MSSMPTNTDQVIAQWCGPSFPDLPNTKGVAIDSYQYDTSDFLQNLIDKPDVMT